MNTITKQPKKSVGLFYRRRLRFEIFRRDRYTCLYCGRTIADGIKLTLDHVVPKSKGGDFSAENLLTACHDCNVGKWTAVLSGFEIRELKKMCESMRPQPSIIITI